MRSKLITVVTAVASTLLVGQVAAADAVQEQLRLMEQRMAEMEDRLAATSQELEETKATAREQQSVLSEAGLAEADDRDIRSGVGSFLDEVDINGVAAASYNHRFKGDGDNNLANTTIFTHPDANTFQVDQFVLALDKTATTESRGGFHAELWAGKSADQWIDDINGQEVGIFTAYASYLADVGNGLQVDVGLLPTLLGAEVLQTNKNINVTQGYLWTMQPVTNTGVHFTLGLTDELSFSAGVVNDVYGNEFFDDSRDKAYTAALRYAGEFGSLRVGTMVGKNSTSNLLADDRTSGGAFDEECDSGDDCMTSVFDVVAESNPSDDTRLWANYTWVRNFGRDNGSDGDMHGVAIAGRQQLTDIFGLGARVEYIRMDRAFVQGFDGASNEMGELLTFTLTGDKRIMDCLLFRLEGRYDHSLSNMPMFAFDQRSFDTTPGSSSPALSSRNGQLVGVAQLLYEW